MKLPFAAFGLSLLLAFPAYPAEKKVDFNQQIRPLLSNRCFACHGPDEEERKAKLRLDNREGALKAINLDDPADSELLYRIGLAHDDEDLMPPKGKGTQFEAEEIALIERWIKQDAPYAKHWSYEKPVRPEVPAVKNADWAQNKVDRFILERLEAEGLKPMPPADRHTLARRLALDLTGLPPSWEEAQAFFEDKNEDATSRYVDSLLAKPAFGERWARVWLDLARYADSAGYADDPPRTIWGFRDYVIKSLNANKPFDQFTIEQLAGDLLPEPSVEQLVATAFHRNNTTMAVWMGTTIDCAQCHTHKYDPLTHEEYFKLFAFFNQSEDADRRNESPTQPLWHDSQRKEKKEWTAQVEKFKAELAKADPAAERNTWLASVQKPATWNPAKAVKATAKNSRLKVAAEGKGVQLEGDRSNTDTYTIELAAPAKKSTITGLRLNIDAAQKSNFVLNKIAATWIPAGDSAALGRFVRVDLPGKKKILHLAELEVFSGGENIARKAKAKQSSTGFGGIVTRINDGNTDGDYQKNSATHTAVEDNPWIELDLGSEQAIEQVAIWNRTDSNLESRLAGYNISILDAKRETVWEQSPKDVPNPSSTFSPSGARVLGFKAAVASHEQQGFPAASVLAAKPDLKKGWAIAGGLEKAQRLDAVLNAPLEIEGGKIVVTLEQNSVHKQHLLSHFSFATTGDPNILELSRMPADVLALVRKPKRSAAENKRIATYHKTIAPSLKKTRGQLASFNKKLADLKPGTSVPIMRNLPTDKRRKTHIHLRGSYQSKGAEVSEGVPEVFHELAKRGDTPDRLDLARWIMHEDNPLTARVIANRHWEQLFGIGIVATSEEFGSQGELPSHPELLDWLAVDLRESGWDLKRFIKQLVMSSAYQQQSVNTPELIERDPANRLLARGPRFRISAEMVRDQALAVSGLLSSKMYGAPVKPPQPNMGLKAAFGSATDWQTSSGEDKYRRGLYTTWRRSSPYPSMATFDAPNRETCTVRRSRTNTPLQALVTLNDPVYIEAAQALGKMLQTAAGSEKGVAAGVNEGVRRVLLREPNAKETERLTALYNSVLADYQTAPAEAKKLAGGGPAEAAWTIVANVLLNVDELPHPPPLPARVRRRHWRHRPERLSRQRSRRQSAEQVRQFAGAARARQAALPGQGQTGDLPAHDRLAAQPRPVRLQAGTGQTHRARLSRRVPQRQILRLHFGHTQADGLAAQVVAPRQERHLHVRRHPQFPPARRRHVLHPLDAHRPVQPRPGGAAGVHRVAAFGQAEHGFVGDLRTRFGKPEPTRFRRAHLQRRAAQRR